MTYETSSSELSDPSRGDFTEAAVFDVLGNDRRRECISQLLQIDREGDVSIRTLSEEVATALADDQPSERFQQSVYVSLIQTHLPQLDDHDVVDYHQETATVSAGEHVDMLEEIITLPANERQNGHAADVAGDESAGPAAIEAADRAAGDEPAAFRLGQLFEDDRQPFSRPLQVLASLAVIVVMILSVGSPAVVPETVQVLLALLHVLTLGTLLGIVSL